MKNGHIHNSIPAEAVLKWVVKERDEAKDKVEQLTGYAKALELRIEDLQRELQSAKDTTARIGKMKGRKFFYHLGVISRELEIMAKAIEKI